MHQLAKIGAPLAEVVVYVDRRDVRGASALFEAQDVPRSWHRMAKQRLSISELEVGDHVDDEQGDLRLMRRRLLAALPVASYVLQFALASWWAVPNLLAVLAGLAIAAWLGAKGQPQIEGKTT